MAKIINAPDITCTIRSNGSGRYYISMGVFRKTNDYATPERAKRAAEKEGMTVIGELPDPNAKSLGYNRTKVITTYCSTEELSSVLIEIDGIRFTGILRDVNPVLKKLGYKPLRVTNNMLNPNAGHFLIDEDTPAYCDPGCESYHTM